MFTVPTLVKVFACGLLAISSAASAYYPVYQVYYSRPVMQRVMVPSVRYYSVYPTPVQPVQRPVIIRAYPTMPCASVRRIYSGAYSVPYFSFGFSF